MTTEANRGLESEKLELLTKTEEVFAQKIRALEDENETLQSQHNQEIADIQAKSEESLAQLKNFYEVERDRLDRRIIEEKDKFDKRY